MIGLLLVGAVAIPATSRLCSAPGGLSHNSGHHFLSGRGAGGDGFISHSAYGAPVRPGSRTEPDDLDQFFWQLGDHAAIQSGTEHRHCGAGSAGRHQRRYHVSSPRSAKSSDLQQSESGGRAHSYTGAHIAHSLPLSKVEDLADTTLAQKISQLTGVGMVSISGGQKPAVRIQANPMALASYGLSLETAHRRWDRPT